MHTHDEEARNFLGILVSIVYWLPTMLATNLVFSSSKYVCFLFRVLFFLLECVRVVHHYIKKKEARAQIASIFYKPTPDYNSSYISGHCH
jgi:hypothetical protein